MRYILALLVSVYTAYFVSQRHPVLLQTDLRADKLEAHNYTTYSVDKNNTWTHISHLLPCFPKSLQVTSDNSDYNAYITSVALDYVQNTINLNVTHSLASNTEIYLGTMCA